MRIRRRKTIMATATAAEAAKVARLKDHMIEKRGPIDHHTAAYVQAALDYSVELTRSEYRPLANRNWKIIQQFGVRLVRLLVFLIIALSTLGALSYNTITEIQDGRRTAVEDKCHSGKNFDHRLRVQIAHLPEPRRKEQLANIRLTEALVSTVVPITRRECKHALKAAGL